MSHFHAAPESDGNLRHEVFKRILVPLDLSDERDSLEFASRLAMENRSTVDLLHVIETVDGLPFDDLRGFYDKIESDARATLEEAGKRLHDWGLPANSHVTYGKRAEEILAFAERNGTDLIVIDAGDSALGSVGYKTVFLARCPVLLVR